MTLKPEDKKFMLERGSQTYTDIDRFIEDMTAYYLTDETRQLYQDRVNEAYHLAKETDRPQVVMGEGETFFTVLPNSVIIVSKAQRYYDLLTDKERQLRQLKDSYTNGEIDWKTYSKLQADYQTPNEDNPEV